MTRPQFGPLARLPQRLLRNQVVPELEGDAAVLDRLSAIELIGPRSD